MLNIVLKRGGVLEAKHSKWLPKQQKYTSKTEDVSEIAVCYLYEPLELGEDVRLGDLLSLLQKCPVLSEFVFRREWARELMDEIRGATFKPYTGQYDPDGIEYLEIYKHIEFNSTTREYTGLNRWDLHGMGFELREDQKESYGFKKGERVNWSLSFQSPIDLWETPLRFKNEAGVYESDLDRAEAFKLINTVKLDLPNLGDVIQGVLWELGFHGPKEGREKEKAVLEERVKEIDEGTVKLIPLDDAFKQLKENALKRLKKREAQQRKAKASASKKKGAKKAKVVAKKAAAKKSAKTSKKRK